MEKFVKIISLIEQQAQKSTCEDIYTNYSNSNNSYSFSIGGNGRDAQLIIFNNLEFCVFTFFDKGEVTHRRRLAIGDDLWELGSLLMRKWVDEGISFLPEVKEV